jgi:hypothetical protein
MQPNANSSSLNISALQPNYKYDNFAVQLKSVHNYLSTRIATGTMVAAALEIYRPNLCRYKKMLADRGLLKEIYIEKCKVTGFKAMFLTCDPEIIKRLNR